MEQNISINRIVNASILQELPDAFYEATGLATGIHDLNGELITSIPKNCFTTFCRNMFFSSEGHKKCSICNNKGDQRAFEIKGPHIYRCHAGLIDVAAPIIVNGHHMGTISCGQILLQPLNEQYRQRVRRKLASFPDEFIEIQMNALESVPVIPLTRIKALSRLLWALANNLVNLVNKYIREKELNVKNSKLIDEIKAQSNLEKEIKNAQLSVKEAELKALQAQINPHFLYNTLDSIQWLAVIHGVEDIQKMINSLGQLMRHSLNTKHIIVTLREELEKLKHYICIQKIRYGDKIDIKINIENEAIGFLIPKLILQPIIENAIQHGLEPKPESGSVWINGLLTDKDELLIEVVDDGVGMDEKAFSALNRRLNSQNGYLSEGNENRHKVGLLNVHKRLCSFLGLKYGLKLTMNKLGGLTVSFLIPTSQDVKVHEGWKK